MKETANSMRTGREIGSNPPYYTTWHDGGSIYAQAETAAMPVWDGAAWMGIEVDMWTYLEFPGLLQIPKYQEISSRHSRANLTIAAIIINPASGQPASEDQRPRLQWADGDLASLPAPQSAIF